MRADPSAELDDLQPRLEAGLAELGLALSEAQQLACLAHLRLVAQWGQVYNLTAVRSPADMLTHHLLDCLAVVPALQRHLAQTGWAQSATTTATAAAAPVNSPSHALNLESRQRPRLLDVGSGAGFPGVVLAVCLPGLDVVCVDTVAKKAAFIQQAAIALKLPNLRGVHARVETLREPAFDVVTSRAFASLADFVTLTRFHVKQPNPEAAHPSAVQAQGLWMAMKGQVPQAEIEALPPSVRLERVEPLSVPQLEAQRCLVWMSPTPAT
jgi:16S rRNA (guanine527-N7)-methyltransferase